MQMAESPAPLGETVLVPVAKVKPYPGNPRRIPDKAIEQTAASIREFGWQQPLVVDENMVIVVGHTRFAAAKYLGESQVPVVIADQLTPAQIKAYRIADNRARDYTTWDFPQLMSELDGLDDDFAEVLDLADWQAIISQYEEDREEALLNVDPDAAGALSGDGHRLTVTFDSQESADKAAPGILDLPGVVNVAYSRR